MTGLVAPSRMEPARIEEPSRELTSLCEQLAETSASIGKDLNPAFLASLPPLIAVLDATCSNRLEKIELAPEDIEGLRLKGGEAQALWSGRGHVEMRGCLEGWRTGGGTGSGTASGTGEGTDGHLQDPSSLEAILALHEGLCAGAPFEHRARMGAGRLRDHDVMIGEHVPPPHDVLPAFMAHFHKRYRQDWLHRPSARLLAVAAAHHRLAFIHPFADGNGRTGRLQSHAMLCATGMRGLGFWSLSSALYRGMDVSALRGEEYRRMMAFADRPRQGDRDGRGNLSQAALESFCKWFLSVCLSEAERMRALLDPKEVARRITLLGDPDLAREVRAFCLDREPSGNSAIMDLVAYGALRISPSADCPVFTVWGARRMFPEIWIESSEGRA